MSLFAELKRRNVFRVALAYTVVAWLLLQIGDTLAPALRLPDWATSLLAFFLILGFPLAIFFAWAYEMTPEGLKLEKDVESDKSVTTATGRKLNFLTIGLLAIAVAYFAYDKFSGGDEAMVAVDAATERHSIAVLPFVNMSSDPEQEYFSDGLSEELLNLLARIPQLRVTSRSSAFFFKGKDAKIADIGRELGVSYVLEGSVRRSEDSIRITAQLIDVSNDSHVWSETWDRGLTNIFDIQDEIAAAVASALRIQLIDELPHAYVTDPDAYALFLRTSELMSDYSQAGLERAEVLLQQTLEIDPDYAPALARLSSIYSTMAAWSYRPREETARLARTYAQRAVDSEPNFADGYLELADYELNERHDLAAAERYIEKALAIEPQSLNARHGQSFLSTLRGDAMPSLKVAREMVKTDPLSAIAYRHLGHAAMYERHYDESIQALRKVQQIEPDSIVNHTTLGQALFLAQHYEEALAEFEQEPIEEFRLYGRAMVYFRLGDAEKSEQAIQALIEMDDGTWAAQIAGAQAVRGEIDSAIQWLNWGYERYDIGVNVSAVNPFLENLHGDPRFEEFLVRLQSPPGLTD